MVAAHALVVNPSFKQDRSTVLLADVGGTTAWLQPGGFPDVRSAVRTGLRNVEHCKMNFSAIGNNYDIQSLKVFPRNITGFPLEKYKINYLYYIKVDDSQRDYDESIGRIATEL